MSGFKNFVLRGNLVDLAVAVIIGTAFGAVVTAFTKALTSLLPGGFEKVFSETNVWGAFINALIAFLILAAVVYFFVVLPYTKAKERFFPEEATGPSEAELLTQIRDALTNRPI